MARRRVWASLRRVTRRWSWPLIGIAVLVTLTLGFWGFSRYHPPDGARYSGLTRMYLSLQLFFLDAGDVSGTLPWQLEVARMVAPLLAAFAAIRTVVAMVRTQADRSRSRRQRKHVVVAGLANAGVKLSLDLSHQGYRVVGVDEPVTPATARELRAAGVLVLEADPSKVATLRAARVDRAAHLVVATSQDRVTVQVVAAARELISGGAAAGRVACVALLTDPDLCTMLSADELQRGAAGRLQVDFLDPQAVGAAALLPRHPPIAESGTGPTLMVVGSGDVACRVQVALGRGGKAQADNAAVILVGISPEQLAERLAESPELGSLTRLSACSDIGQALSGARQPVVAYVCDQDEQDAVRHTIALRRVLDDPSRIIVVRPEVTPITRLLTHPQAGDGPEIDVVGLRELAWRPDIVLDGTTGLLAKALHEMYLEYRSTDQAVDAGDPALRPWDELPESLRASNRAQAAHIAVKLKAIDRVLIPAALSPAPAFTAQEVECMSVLEHERWVEERRASGWRPGPRDAQARTTPYLVPWQDLSEEIRDYDRLFIRRLPELLASVGLQARPARPPDRPSGRHHPLTTAH